MEEDEAGRSQPLLKSLGAQGRARPVSLELRRRGGSMAILSRYVNYLEAHFLEIQSFSAQRHHPEPERQGQTVSKEGKEGVGIGAASGPRQGAGRMGSDWAQRGEQN